MIIQSRRQRLGWQTPFPERPFQPAFARPIPPSPALAQRIVRPTAVLIDKSEAMERAIQLGQQVLELIAPLCRADLFVYAFDTMAYAIRRTPADVGRWDGPISRIAPGGSKACGSVVEGMRMRQEYAEQFVLITDERENASPTFVEAFETYAAAMKVAPEVCIVRTPGGSDCLTRRCREAGVALKVLALDNSDETLPKLLSFLN